MTERYLEPPLQTASIGGRQLAWRETGSGGGLPLLLMHGIGSNARAWAGQFAGFASDRRVVAWNAPGYDQSDPLASEWPTPRDYALVARDLLRHLRIDSCIVVGQSLGAIMATALARLAPEQVDALVLLSPAAGYGIVAGGLLPPTVAARVADLRSLGAMQFAARRAGRLLTSNASATASDIVHRAMAEVTPMGYLHAARLLAVADLAPDVAKVRVPVTVMWGSEDVITPPLACREIATAARCNGIELEGLGHGLATEGPDRVNARLRGVIAGVEQRSLS